MNVYILYRDIRTYGEREYLYAGPDGGVLFVQFSKDQKPTVSAEKMASGSSGGPESG